MAHMCVVCRCDWNNEMEILEIIIHNYIFLDQFVVNQFSPFLASIVGRLLLDYNLKVLSEHQSSEVI